MVILVVFVRFEAKMIIEISPIQLAAEAAMSHVDLPRLKHTRPRGKGGNDSARDKKTFLDTNLYTFD